MTLLTKALIKGKNDLKSNKVYSHMLLLSFLILFWQLGFAEAVAFVLLFTFLEFNWDNRIVISLALLSFLICPFLIVFDAQVIAEKVADFAFYCILVTVILQLVEYKHEILQNH